MIVLSSAWSASGLFMYGLLLIAVPAVALMAAEEAK